MSNNKLHHLIPGQLSSQIVEDYPLFVDFLKGYYEWLQTDGTPYHQIRNHLSYLNFEQSLDEYTNLLKEEFFKNLPEKVLADKSLLIKYSKQFFSSVGTEKAFQFIFKVVFGESVELTYPRDMMLIPSNGKWVDDESLMYVSDSGNADSFLYRTITQTKEIFPGIFTYASANVARIIKRYANNFVFAELYLTNVKGDFDLEIPVTFEDKTEWILPIASSYTIDSPGINYVSDNIFQYTSDSTFDVTVIANETDKIDLRYKTLFNENDLIFSLNGSPLTDFTYDGKFISYPNIVLGDEITVSYPVYTGFVVVSELGIAGSVDTVDIIDMPFGVISDQTYIGTGGSGSVVTVHPGVLRQLPGYYIKTDGFLSDKDKLQDSDYYQDFSYVLKSGIDITRYRDLVYAILHPAGFKLIGEVSIIEIINLMISDHKLEIEFRPRDVFLAESAAGLYSRFGNIDDWKHTLGCAHYKVFHFKDVVVGDIIETPNRHYNFSDIKIDVITIGDYFDPGYIDDMYLSPIIFERDLCKIPAGPDTGQYISAGYWDEGYITTNPTT